MGMGWAGLIAINDVVMQTASADFGKKGTLLERDGFRGTRQHNIDDVIAGPYSVSGGITLQPSSADLYTLLNWALGSNDALTPYDVDVNRAAGNYSYPTCCVNSLEISWSEGGLVSAALDLLGTTEAAGSALSAPTTAIPLGSADVAMTVNSVTCKPKSFTLRIANELQTNFKNSNTNQLNAAGTMDATDRVITLSIVVPNDSAHSTLYDMAATGVAGSITIGTVTVTFGKLVAPPESAPLAGKGEVYLTINLSAKRHDTTADVTVSTSS